MTVRPGRPADRERLRVVQQALPEPSPPLLEAAIDGTTTDPGTDDGPLGLFVRVADGSPVGYAITVEGSAVYVLELAVHSDRQREGHGSALIDALCERFRSREALRLTVAVTNERARQFYSHHGFEQVDRLADYFESGDALVLAKNV